MEIKKILEVKYLNKIYGFGKNSQKAVNDVSFDLLDGEFLGIMGTSGSGKTSILNMIAAITKASNGEIIYKAEELSSFSKKKLLTYRGNEVSYIFQDFRLIESLTALENIIIPQKIHDKEIDFENIYKLARELEIYEILNKYPNKLSGGEKQRVSALRALAINPQIILADEPTGALDSYNSKKLLEILKGFNQTYKKSIIMVTHDSYAASFCQRILFLKDGRIYNEISKDDDENQREYLNRITLSSKQIIKWQIRKKLALIKI